MWISLPPGTSPLAAASAPGLSAPVLWLTGIERWVVLAALSIALGGLAGRALGRHYQGTMPAPLPSPWVLRASVLGAAASGVALLTAVADPAMAASLARPPALGLPSDATAVIAGVECVLFAVAALQARLGLGSPVTALMGVVVAESLRAHPEGMIPVAGAALTFCHLLPSVLWAGMLLYVVRGAIAWRHDPRAMQGLVRQYAVAAAWLLVVVAITGAFSALLLVPVGSLLTTDYGRVLVLKGVLVAVAAGLAIGGRVWLGRRATAGEGPPLATKLEVGALAAVLAVTALLTVLTPPAKPIYAATGAVHTRVAQARPAALRR